MKNAKFYSIFAMFLLVIGYNQTKAQDIHFSQFYMAPMQQNPAMAGVNYAIQGVLNYKDQWRAVGSPYKTFACSYDMRIESRKNKNGFIAMGINFFNDKAGDSNMGQTLANYSLVYHVKLSQFSTLGAGIQTGFFQRSLDFTGLMWGNQYDGVSHNYGINSGEGFGQQAFSRFDLGSGIVWSYDNNMGKIKVNNNQSYKYHLGFSTFHVNRPQYSFLGSDERLYMRFVLHGGATLSVPNSNFAFMPGFMTYMQGPAREIYFGSLFRYILGQDSKFTGLKNGSAIYIGSFYRTRDAITTHLLVEYSDWTVGVSYDFNLSTLRAATNARGGMEFSLRYALPVSHAKGSSHARY